MKQQKTVEVKQRSAWKSEAKSKKKEAPAPCDRWCVGGCEVWHEENSSGAGCQMVFAWMENEGRAMRQEHQKMGGGCEVDSRDTRLGLECD